MAAAAVHLDASDLAAMVKVILAATGDWPDDRRARFRAAFDQLVDERRLLSFAPDPTGRIAVDASADFLALLARFGIGAVTP